MPKFWFCLLAITLLLTVACARKTEAPAPALAGATDPLSAKLARYAPVTLKWDPSVLSAEEKEALRALIEAAKIMDELFYLQVHPKALEWREQMDTPALKRYYAINFGPWDALDGGTPFWGHTPKPKGGGFYPLDMTKEEFEAHLAAHPEDREAFTSYFTVIVREGGTLKAVPYSDYFKERLAKASFNLSTAASLVTNPTLKKYLESRSKAFLSNDYLPSDMDWMDIRDSRLDPTIGPYETYGDELFGYKAAFEAFIAVADPVESAKLEYVAGALPDLDRTLPYPKDFKGRPKGMDSPISVVNLVFNAGDAKAGVQTIAFNLPNDERVVAAKGSKKVMLKNVIEAKYEAILKPIGGILIGEEARPFISPAAFFNHVLFHEVSHGMGPGILDLPDGTQTSVRERMKDLYSGLEEAKADVGGIHLVSILTERGQFPPGFKNETAVTNLASMFRSMRFGLHEAHGKGVLIQFNWLVKKNAIFRTDAGLYQLDPDLFYQGMEALLAEIYALQAAGDYDAAKRFMDQWTMVPEHLEADLARLSAVPVDIEPVFQLEF
jgi:hypothetical protein